MPSIPNKAVTPRICLFTCIDTDGEVILSMTQVNTDKKIKMLYLSKLGIVLDRMNPGWRETSFIIMDGAKYNTNEETRQWISALKMPVMFLAPYMYSGSAVEYFFAYLKNSNLNPDRLATGKT